MMKSVLEAVVGRYVIFLFNAMFVNKHVTTEIDLL